MRECKSKQVITKSWRLGAPNKLWSIGPKSHRNTRRDSSGRRAPDGRHTILVLIAKNSSASAFGGYWSAFGSSPAAIARWDADYAAMSTQQTHRDNTRFVFGFIQPIGGWIQDYIMTNPPKVWPSWVHYKKLNSTTEWAVMADFWRDFHFIADNLDRPPTRVIIDAGSLATCCVDTAFYTKLRAELKAQPGFIFKDMNFNDRDRWMWVMWAVIESYAGNLQLTYPGP